MYARVWRKLCKLEYIVRNNLWPVRVLKWQRKIRTLTGEQCPTGRSRSGLGMPLGTAARTSVEDIVGKMIENGRIKSELWVRPQSPKGTYIAEEKVNRADHASFFRSDQGA